MKVKELIKHIESWAPPGVAWEGDNVGLQIGSGQSDISNILLALELDEKSLNQAIRKNCNFIFTHHPFIFKPIKRIDTSKDLKSRLIEKLIKNDISLFSAHTNLDFSRGGVSFELAKVLGLKNIRFLENTSGDQCKLVVFVPKEAEEKVAQAVFKSDAGIIGEYKNCSFRLDGKGTFEGSEKSSPVVGMKQNYESVDEVRLEVIVEKWNIKSVINAMIEAHPYEEPAYDIYPLNNTNPNYGYGAIGELESSMNPDKFLGHVCESLNTKSVRFCKGKKNSIKSVAVCGGSGADLINSVIGKKADAYVTGDIKYHAFQDAENEILLVDAGHYETEIHSLNAVKKNLEAMLKSSRDKIKVFKYSGSTNPVKFYNN